MDINATKVEDKVVVNTNGLSLTGKDIMPTKESERTVSSVGFFMISVGMYVQLVSFIAGAQLYPALSPIAIILSAILGNVIVWALLVLTGDIGLKHGIPYAVYARAPFGYLGAHIPGLIRALPAIFWFGFQTWLGAMAINEIMIVLTGYSNLTLIIIIFGAFQIWNTASGINAIEKFDWVATPVLFATGLYILYFLITEYDITMADFLQPGEGGFSFLTAMAIMAGAQITMAVSIADMTRFLKRGKNESFFVLNRGSIHSQFWGLIIPMALFVAIGMVSGIATGEWNPITVMTEIFKDNIFLLVFVLGAFVIFAQVASNTGQNLMPPGYVFVNLFPKKIKFSVAVVIAGVIGLLIQPWEFANYTSTLLLIISCLLGPILGIMVSDYYMVRRRKLSIDDLYDSNGQYRYYKNFNPAAFIGFIPGIISGVFFPDYAFFVSMIIGAAVYYILMTQWILKKYPQKEVIERIKS
ncbi:thiamine permease [Peribacillus cavernae]|uniref:Thiamine permease n=1 Tax=Peribacillus cavernae TaxID=1674310 RepID=A0A3S0VFH8_9BACI|nr:cytosine permease [Peribacillus cavernae]MDQ0221192.1 NCS1 family nucleobase:cation symporter-1 [Peribacillus cavernae]RUQ26929.1 thiamine permease [Peribacillus cavernae]